MEEALGEGAEGSAADLDMMTIERMHDIDEEEGEDLLSHYAAKHREMTQRASVSSLTRKPCHSSTLTRFSFDHFPHVRRPGQRLESLSASSSSTSCATSA